MNNELTKEIRSALFEYLLRLGDDLLVLGHRLSEWCGHAPILEEDLALANIALDCIGQSEALLKLAGEVEGEGRSEDDLAYFRDEYEFRNCELVEQPKGDFAYTICRQFIYGSWLLLLYEDLSSSEYKPLADIASKGVKEITYHLRHSREWMLRLGGGTEESNSRLQNALDEIWRFTDELFYKNSVDEILIAEKMIPDVIDLRPAWEKSAFDTIKLAELKPPPSDIHMKNGARIGRHSEHLGHLLAELQIVARSHPGAKW